MRRAIGKDGNSSDNTNDCCVDYYNAVRGSKICRRVAIRDVMGLELTFLYGGARGHSVLDLEHMISVMIICGEVKVAIACCRSGNAIGPVTILLSHDSIVCVNGFPIVP